MSLINVAAMDHRFCKVALEYETAQNQNFQFIIFHAIYLHMVSQVGDHASLHILKTDRKRFAFEFRALYQN